MLMRFFSLPITLSYLTFKFFYFHFDDFPLHVRCRPQPRRSIAASPATDPLPAACYLFDIARELYHELHALDRNEQDYLCENEEEDSLSATKEAIQSDPARLSIEPPSITSHQG